MPDALSKTVPIWCAVLNRLLFPERIDMHHLHTPKSTVGMSEHAQMDAKLKDFLRDAVSLQLDMLALRASVQKPLVPSWITPAFEDMSAGNLVEYNQIICCTASRRVEGAELSENGYIQGAADDHEGWSHGLTPSMFWAHSGELLEMPEEDIPNFVRHHLAVDEMDGGNGGHALRIMSTNLHISALVTATSRDLYDGLISISDQEDPLLSKNDENKGKNRPLTLHVPCRSGKLGSRALRTHLEQVINFLTPLFSSKKSPTILITCHDGKDLSVGVALAILCLFYDDDGQPNSTTSGPPIDKTMIRQRLAKITTAKPDANPSRATLQSVHAFLMP